LGGLRRVRILGSRGFFTMEPERINLIGGKLADLAARTEALRGYL
jgi:hypothetical protein